jgi:hypothetical protein
MAKVKRLYTKEEVAERGDEMYETLVKPKLKKKDKGRIVALDIESGEWAIGKDVLAASHRLQAKGSNPESTLFVRVGFRYVYKFGWSDPSGEHK